MLARPLAAPLAKPLALPLTGVGGYNYALYKSYVAAVQASAAAPTSGWSAFKSRFGKALQTLDDAGILTNLIDGAYYGSDGQLSAGFPLAYSGAAASTNTGSYTRGTLGITMNQSDNQHIWHPLPDGGVAKGTFLVDTQYDWLNDTPPSTQPSSTGFLTNAGFNNSVGTFGQGNADQIFCTNGTYNTQDWGALITSPFGDGAIWMKSHHRNTVAIAFGDGTPSFVWRNGDPNPVTAGNVSTYTQSTKLTHFQFGYTRAPGWPIFKGRNHGWMTFNKRLTDSEVLAAGRAMTVLDRRPCSLLIQGDSTSALMYDAYKSHDNWPEKILSKTGFDESVRVTILAAIAGRTVPSMVDGFEADIVANIVEGKKNIYLIWGGINHAGLTAEQLYDGIKSNTQAAKALGCVTIIPTIAIPNDVPVNIQRMRDLNALIRAGEGVDFDIMVDVDAAIPSHVAPYDVLWSDYVHLNGAGNDIVAGLIRDAIAHLF